MRNERNGCEGRGGRYSVTVLGTEDEYLYTDTFDDEDSYGSALADYYGCRYRRVAETWRHAVVGRPVPVRDDDEGW